MAVVTQAEFARLSNAGRSTVAGWIEKGTISGDALVHSGGKLLIDAEKASHQVRKRRDIGQALGNGLHIRTATRKPAIASSDAVVPETPPAAAVGIDADGWGLFATPSDPYERGFLAGALAVAYQMPALAAFHAIEAGASLPVAYTLSKRLKSAARQTVAEQFVARFLTGDLYPLRYPADWDPAAVAASPWTAHAESLGEPVDVPAWEAWAVERDALNYPED